MQLSINGQAALEYATAFEWSVFPCNLDKTPRTRHGFKDATADTTQIQKWWDHYPDSSIGFALPTNIVVVDADVNRHAGKYGDESLKEFETAHGKFPDTVTALTGGGGLHYFFQTDKPVTNTTNLLPSVDIRTHGGYVILPPSNHPSGNSYAWEYPPTDVSIAQLPPPLYAFMTARKQRTVTKDKPTKVIEGERNSTLFKIASSMRGKGFDGTEILAAIMRENQELCTPPLSNAEVQAIAKSVSKYERGKPAMNGKSSFVLHTNDWEHIETLTMQERGELMTAIFEYTISGALPEFSGALGMLFSVIRAQLDRDAAKWEKTRSARAAAGKEGAGVRWHGKL